MYQTFPRLRLGSLASEGKGNSQEFSFFLYNVLILIMLTAVPQKCAKAYNTTRVKFTSDNL